MESKLYKNSVMGEKCCCNDNHNKTWNKTNKMSSLVTKYVYWTNEEEVQDADMWSLQHRLLKSFLLPLHYLSHYSQRWLLQVHELVFPALFALLGQFCWISAPPFPVRIPMAPSFHWTLQIQNRTCSGHFFYEISLCICMIHYNWVQTTRLLQSFRVPNYSPAVFFSLSLHNWGLANFFHGYKWRKFLRGSSYLYFYQCF